MNRPYTWGVKRICALLLSVMALMVLAGMLEMTGYAQQPGSASIRGTVIDAKRVPVAGASVLLERKDHPGVIETKTNPSGTFVFSSLPSGSYRIHSEKSSLRSRATEAFVLSAGEQKQIVLALEDSGADKSMEFSDQPNFTVAGVTDWTAAGGHGSDARLRTSEDLAREAIVLKAEGAGRTNPLNPSVAEEESMLRAALVKSPDSFEANHQLGEFYLREGRYAAAVPLLEAAYKKDPASDSNTYDLALACKDIGDFTQARHHVETLLAHKETAALHRLSGEIDEAQNDPLTAVREYEKAVRLDPSEENYFLWGSELLVHRAVQPAVEVFRKGAETYPTSARMLSALGAALFASGLYNEAALRLCAASDLNPEDSAPYLFLGKVDIAAPEPLTCAEQKLAQFAQEHPDNAQANYFYAMAIWKQQARPVDSSASQQIKALLAKAVSIDNKYSDAYLQLGIFYASQRNFERAVAFYTKAIAANPQLSEAHYRLGVAYDRTGEKTKARLEFQLHDQIEKQQAAEVERQRREIKQFLVILQGQSNSASR